MKNDILMPDYNHSILGLITSILKYYNVETNHKSLEKIDKILEKKYNNIVFIVLDGLGENILNIVDSNGYFSENKIDLVTSVYPSTTTAALTTYYSGKPPFETGWIAWSQYFKEYGRAVDMLQHRESYLHEDLSKARMNVFENIVNYETIFEKIEKASPDVKAFELMPSYSDRRSRRSIRTDNIDEIIDNIELLTKIPDKKFMMAYSDKPDGLLHKYGTTSTEVKEFVLEAETKIKNLREKLDDDTLIIVSADHGHKDIDKYYSILDYPKILDCLFMPISFESRFVGFWVKEDKKKEFEEEFNKEFGEEFWLLKKEEFLEKNFLGFGEKHPKVDDFLGNYVAISTAGSMIQIETFLVEGKGLKKSTHCGLSREEMEVPIFVLKNGN